MVVVSAALASHECRAERLPIRTYTTADGLPNDSVNRIVQDSRGYLWICTDEGLSRFDGYSFTNYGVADGLPGPIVMDILERRDGSYWVATQSGLARLVTQAPDGSPSGQAQQARFESLPMGSSPAAALVRVLHEDRQQVLWVGTMDGLYRVAPGGDQWSPRRVEFPFPRGSPTGYQVNDLLEDEDGTLWIATRGTGLLRLRPQDRMDRLTRADGLPSENVRSVRRDQAGLLWVGTSDGACRIRTSAEGALVERCSTMRDGLPHLSTRSLLWTRSRLLYAATDAGLAVSRPASAGSGSFFKADTVSRGMAGSVLTC